MDSNTELMLKNSLESGNKTVIVRKVLDSAVLKHYIVHQMMENSDINMCSLNRRKGEHFAYIIKKDDSQMEQFSWNEVFMEAYSVMSEFVHLIIACMIRKFATCYEDAVVINQVIPKVGLIYSIIA